MIYDKNSQKNHNHVKSIKHMNVGDTFITETGDKCLRIDVGIVVLVPSSPSEHNPGTRIPLCSCRETSYELVDFEISCIQ